MNKLAKWILVMITITAVCAATAEAATWTFKSTGRGYEDQNHPEWGVYDGSGWLTAWGTINCDPQAKLVDTEGRLVDRLWVVADDEIEVEIPIGQGYNDFLALFEWNFPCENKVWYKMYVCKDGELVPALLPEWINDNFPRGESVTLPSLADPTGTDPNIYIVVNLRLWRDNPTPPQETYIISNGECPELQGFRFGTTKFDYRPEEICHPLVTDNPYTGTLYNHADIGVLGEPQQIPRPPTVSQWGLIIMAALLALAGTIAIVRRKQQIAT